MGLPRIRDKVYTKAQRDLYGLIKDPVEHYRLNVAEFARQGISLQQYVGDDWFNNTGQHPTEEMLAVIAIEDALLDAKRDVLGLTPPVGSS